MAVRKIPAIAALVATLVGGHDADAELPARLAVTGPGSQAVTQVEVGLVGDPGHVSGFWSALASTPRGPGKYRVAFEVPANAAAVEIPVCAGRSALVVDGARTTPGSPAPIVVPLAKRETPHAILLEIDVGKYEKRIACGAAPRFGASQRVQSGLLEIGFPSPMTARGGGKALVYLPAGGTSGPRPLLVGLHPWNGGIWTYAAYEELLHEAEARGVVLLMPSGLGNSLYVEAAEDEVFRAIDALEHDVAIDPARVSLWGASMGGAGATTIALHRPDRFASVTSYFGDSKYDLATYVRSILHDAAGAHAVDTVDLADNARYLDLWLVHGEADHVSPIVQSELLANAVSRRGIPVQFARVAGAEHEGPLVVRYIRTVVDRAAAAHAPEAPPRVTFASVRARDTAAYGIRITRGGGDAFVDIEAKDGAIRIHAARAIREIAIAKSALGGACGQALPFAFDPGVAAIPVHCEP